jgi:hypothetical protein
LVLSDQQLVTGLAILLGAVANLNTLSWYEFSVALSLSWFSSTTHLATLDVLQEYFRLHAVIRNWRVGGMISVLILLTFALLTVSVTGGYGSPVPLACYFSKYSVYPGLEQVNIDPNPIVLAANCLTLYVLLSGYFLRIKTLYATSHILYWHIWKMTTGRFSVQRLHLSVMEHRDIFDAAMNVYESSLRQKNLEKVYGATGWKRWYFIGFYRYDESFLSKLPIVAFSFTYGLSQVVVFRWINHPPQLSPSVKSMNFGQITALFLLVLPIFAATEIYYGNEPSEWRKQNANCYKTIVTRSHPRQLLP